MKIASLNVNNFGGGKEKKPRRNEYGQSKEESDAYDSDLKAFQENRVRITFAEKIAKRLKDYDGDIIVLSEFDIAAPAGKKFIELFHSFNYKLYVPRTMVKSYTPGYSITAVFIRKTMCKEGDPREITPDNRADFNLIRLDGLTIFGVHAKPPREKGPGNFGVLKAWAMKATGDTEKILIIGDFNTYEENYKCPETRDAYKEILGNGYVDLCPKEIPTYIGGTCIDHALVSPAIGRHMKEGKVDRAFIDDSLSDHAAVIIDLYL